MLWHPRSDIELQHVKPADVAVHAVYDPALVDIDVVDLDRGQAASRRRRWHEGGHFARHQRIADVVHAQSAVEQGREDQRLGTQRGVARWILMEIVTAEATALAAILVEGRHGQGAERY